MTDAVLERSGTVPGFTDVVVRRIDVEALDVVSLVLADPSGGDLPPAAPGDHLDVVLPGGLVRQYSVCSGDGDDGCWRVAVLREALSRGGSAFVHEGLHPGDTLQVRGPRSSFRLVPAAAYLFVAGGIGITPIVPMVEVAAASGAAWRLLYLGRRRAGMAFTGRLAVHGDAVRLRPRDECGPVDLVDDLESTALDGGLDLDGAHVYACGPQRLLDAVHDWAARRPLGGLHVERFVAGAVRATEAEDRPFVVETSDGTEVAVPPGQSVLDALAAAGVPVLNSCREGVCGTCETPVLAGTPDHRDQLLSDEERAAGDTMMICVSRCLGERLVLDV